MWSHYSRSHTGFCLGYNTDKLYCQVEGRIGPVIYDREFPKFGLFDDSSTHFIKYAYHKSDIWSYEKEYRIQKPNAAKKVQIISEDTIEEIILGNRNILFANRPTG